MQQLTIDTTEFHKDSFSESPWLNHPVRVIVFNNKMELVYSSSTSFGSAENVFPENLADKGKSESYMVRLELPSGQTLNKIADEKGIAQFCTVKSTHEIVGTHALYSPEFTKQNATKSNKIGAAPLQVQNTVINWSTNKYIETDAIPLLLEFENRNPIYVYKPLRRLPKNEGCIKIKYTEENNDEASGKHKEKYYALSLPSESIKSIAFNTATIKRFPEFTVLTRTPEADALLSYWFAGDLSSARTMGTLFQQNAVDLFAGKFDNYPAACVAGYYLLWTQQDESVPEWWYRNLADHNQFSGRSDGAVIYAHYLLRKEKYQECLEQLKQAASRGLPLYSQGAKMMLDGLSMYFQDPAWEKEHEAINTLVSTLEPYAKTIHWSRPYTLFELPEEAAVAATEESDKSQQNEHPNS